MTCDELRLAIPEYLTRDLPESGKRDFQNHMQLCAGCRSEVADLTALWLSIGQLPQPEPGPLLRTRFAEMLSAYEHGMERGRRESASTWLRTRWGSLWAKRTAWQAAVAAACLLIGLSVGRWTGNRETAPSAGEVATLRGELAAMRQLITLSLLQQQSPNDRLEGVNWSVRVEEPTPEVPAALLFAVSNDDNVNVRLAAVDALHRYASDGRTRNSLLSAIRKQDSPLVQVAIIGLLSQLHDPKLAEPLETLASDPRVDKSVRRFARSALGKMRLE